MKALAMLCGYPFRARAQATTARKPRPLLACTFSRIAVPLAREGPTTRIKSSHRVMLAHVRGFAMLFAFLNSSTFPEVVCHPGATGLTRFVALKAHSASPSFLAISSIPSSNRSDGYTTSKSLSSIATDRLCSSAPYEANQPFAAGFKSPSNQAL